MQLGSAIRPLFAEPVTYVCAKHSQVKSDWPAYRHVRNEVNNLMKEAYHNYCKHLFEDSHTNNCKRFWSLIKHRWKSSSYILTSLKVDEKWTTSPLDKAEALNNQFLTFFTDENTAVPTWNPAFHYLVILPSLLQELRMFWLIFLLTNHLDLIPNFVLNFCTVG